RAPGSGRGGDGAQAAVGPGGHDRGSDLMEGDWLPLVWLLLIAFAIFMYVLLDGFVLGVGILFPFARSDADRDAMMMSVAPIWDGNETWLVLGVGGLLAVFPVAYAIVLPALYQDRKSTRLNSSHVKSSYAVFCLKKKKHTSELQ